MKRYDIVVIGGGASGMSAAITAGRAGRSVLLLEASDRVGRKILATGNGKCNFTHEQVSEASYQTDAPEMLAQVLQQIGTAQVLDFFQSLGMLSKEKNGYYYPQSETASTVLDLLRFALEQTGCRQLCDCYPVSLEKTADGDFSVHCAQGTFLTSKVILACGSPAGGFLQKRQPLPEQIAGQFGLSFRTNLPALTKCSCREDYFKLLAGVRADASLTLLEQNRRIRQETGEVQFTAQGLSGIPFFQLSGDVAQLLQNGKKPEICICFRPEIPDPELFLKKRLDVFGERSIEAFFTGIWQKKITQALCRQAGVSLSARACDCDDHQLQQVISLSSRLSAHPVKMAAIEEAQVCRGGIALQEMNRGLECRKVPGLFCCGELLNVDGICGGYNLHWAWASGMIAGQSASQKE